MRLIDADALLEDFAERQNLDCSDGEFCDCFLNSGQEVSTEWWCVEDAVESAPTIDAVPVVRCKDCVYRGAHDLCPMCVRVYQLDENGYLDCTVDDGYCHRGAKMDAKEEDE